MSISSGHFYDLNGLPVFEVPNKSKGGMRPTTVADARRLGLYASVTTAMKAVLAKEGLDGYKTEQVIRAVQERPQFPGEDFDAYADVIQELSERHMNEAADLGVRIHKAIENHFQRKPYDQDMLPYVAGVVCWAQSEGVVFEVQEKIVVNHEYKFAGTIDGVIQSRHGRGIIDFKGRNTKPGSKPTAYPEQKMQLAAYLRTYQGEFQPDDRSIACVSVYVSRNEPGRVDAEWFDAQTMHDEWAMFLKVLQYFQLRKKLL